MAYINTMAGHDGAATPPTEQSKACFICEAAKVTVPSDDAGQQLVLLRDKRGLIMLNLYPYVNGHLLVAPLDHTPDLPGMTAPQRADLLELVTLAQSLLQAAINPQGFNIGLNLGRCAGAGLPGHLHAHVVPRWSGDTNYMQTIGRIRVIPEAIQATYTRLRDTLNTLQQTKQ